MSADLSRGWLLGWQAGSLTPLPSNHLDDQLATSTNNYFLSSIWMSGYGVAAHPSGNLYFVTGNSDYSGTSYNTMTNLSESVVKILPDLTTVVSFFTPSDQRFGVPALDKKDSDFGSGGVLLLPDQTESSAALALAAGRVGQMYLLNPSNLGGYSSNGKNQVLGTFSIGGCWCGQSYFQGWDLNGRVVSSGGNESLSGKFRLRPLPILLRKVHRHN